VDRLENAIVKTNITLMKDWNFITTYWTDISCLLWVFLGTVHSDVTLNMCCLYICF